MVKKIIIFSITMYQKLLSPDKGVFFSTKRVCVCVFYPTCSEYAKEAFKRQSIFKATVLSFKRITRCHPWQENHIDPL